MIRENVQRLLDELPDGVELVAAAKQRKPEEIMEAIEAGVQIIGENYIGEAKNTYRRIGEKAQWHFIGISQAAKHDLLRRPALEMFDMIETIDTEDIAVELDTRCAQIRKVMPILIEINSGREPQKAGVTPDKAEELIDAIAVLQNIHVMGLMTMGPRFGDPEASRPFFIETRKVFDKITTLDLPHVTMKYLSMGMTNSYKIAIEEGANMVRIGSKLFGERA